MASPCVRHTSISFTPWRKGKASFKGHSWLAFLCPQLWKQIFVTLPFTSCIKGSLLFLLCLVKGIFATFICGLWKGLLFLFLSVILKLLPFSWSMTPSGPFWPHLLAPNCWPGLATPILCDLFLPPSMYLATFPTLLTSTLKIEVAYSY
jgi:hypothetical protein